MDTEFGGGKFKRLFHGLMWSGLDRKDIGDPRKVSLVFFLTLFKVARRYFPERRCCFLNRFLGMETLTNFSDFW